jgi:hypothetical protein
MGNEARWAKQILSRSQFPKFIYEGDAIPKRGWVIEAFSQVFKDGEPVGLFVEMQVARDGKSVLSTEGIGSEPLVRQ